MRHTPIVTGLLICLLLLASCSSSTNGSSSTNEGAATEDSAPASTSTAESSVDQTSTDSAPPASVVPEVLERPTPVSQTFVDESGEEVEDLDVPADLFEVVQAGADEGIWTEPAGLAAALGGLSNATEPRPGLTLDDVLEPGLTGLMRHSQDLLDRGDMTSQDRTQLETAMAPFAIDQQDLDLVEPSERSGLSPITDADAAGGPACARLDTLGFDVGSNDDKGKCYTYDFASDASGFVISVFYPKDWEQDPERLALVDAALESGVASNNTYAELATTIDLNIVFGLGVDDENEDALAYQVYFDPETSGCPIGIYTPANAQLSLDQFKQVVAHEVFHCVQDLSFDTKPYETHVWWMEGSAEYFSNVVYPLVNFEFRFVTHFDKRSLEWTPEQMNYHLTVFYQYYANRNGNPATIEMIRNVAAAGATDAALASVAGMEELWQDFIVAFSAGQVFDTGGEVLGPARFWSSPRQTVDKKGPIELELLPLIGTRYRLQYKKERRFVQDPGILARPHAMAPIEDRRDPLAWTLTPPEIRTKCGEDSVYILVATSVQDAEIFELEVTEVEEAPCDPCVLGAWDAQLETFKDALNASFAGAGGQVSSIDGHYYFNFGEDRDFLSLRQPLLVTISANGFSAPPIEIRGQEAGTYLADGTELTVSDITAEGAARVGGGGFVSSGPEFLQGQPSAYECTDETLTITDPTFGTLVLDRIDAIPSPDGVGVEAGSPDSD